MYMYMIVTFNSIVFLLSYMICIRMEEIKNNNNYIVKFNLIVYK